MLPDKLHQIGLSSGENKETTFLFQRMSVIIQQFNAVSALFFCQGWSRPLAFPALLLPFLFLTLRIYPTEGKKIISNSNHCHHDDGVDTLFAGSDVASIKTCLWKDQGKYLYQLHLDVFHWFCCFVEFLSHLYNETVQFDWEAIEACSGLLYGWLVVLEASLEVFISTVDFYRLPWQQFSCCIIQSWSDLIVCWQKRKVFCRASMMRREH